MKKVLALLCLVLAANAWAKPQLLACIDEFPPYQMLGEPPLGEHVAALEVLADKLARPLAFTTEPDFSHCLQRLKSGEADLIAGLIDKPARHEFLHMLPMRRESAYFFVTRSQGPVIEDYDDLHHHLIAVSKDYYYFPRFDQDPQLKKIAVDNVHIAYKLLLAGRGGSRR
ncbi:type 2 periplasmic-binding domain-containing protein [Bowmanella dokdonensis]|uniref:Transporter substrate-binding domain-containing protein n=1 Tax=Bowmanella dokdonensis TaxID=751969 RepID=A0A939DP50_9ALTE|nr:transporter substrate-binding domain-containing protein [Bowmanella dokdonensis]